MENPLPMIASRSAWTPRPLGPRLSPTVRNVRKRPREKHQVNTWFDGAGYLTKGGRREDADHRNPAGALALDGAPSRVAPRKGQAGRLETDGRVRLLRAAAGDGGRCRADRSSGAAGRNSGREPVLGRSRPGCPARGQAGGHIARD